MKKTALIVLFALLLGSCCKQGPYPVVGLKVKYTNLTTSSGLKAIRTDRNNISSVLDTISLGELNSSNSYSLLIEFEQNSPNYILYIENSSYIDTISNINYERKRCKSKIKNFEYEFNGEKRTETELMIK